MSKLRPLSLYISKIIGHYVDEKRQGNKKRTNKERVAQGKRKEYETSQLDLAQKLGVSAQFLGKIEKGEVPMPPEVQIKLIRLMKISKKKLKEFYSEASDAYVNDMFKQAK